MQKRTLTVWLSILAVSLVTLAASVSFAQPAAGGGGGRRGGGAGGPGGGGMAAFAKDQLKASDDEWKVIEPLLVKVSDLQRQARPNMRGMMGGRGGRGGQGGAPDAAAGDAAPAAPATPQASGMPESDALAKVLADANAKPEDIKAKLDAYRVALKKVNDQLKTAREDLRKVLTPKQEAQLVLMGTLD